MLIHKILKRLLRRALGKDRRFGWIKQEKDKRDFIKIPRTKIMVERPEKASLEDKMPFIYDQLELGSCVMNATYAACHYFYWLHGKAFMPSRLFGYYWARWLMGWWYVFFDSGSTIRAGIKAAAKYGTCHEELWPYVIDKFRMRPDKKAQEDGLNFQVLKYEAVVNLPEHIESCIAEGCPVVFGMLLYESFVSEQAAITGIIPIPNRNSEKILGGHAMLIVGYDRKRNKYRVRNSWGEDWGMKGYCEIDYETITKDAADLWVIYVVEQ